MPEFLKNNGAAMEAPDCSLQGFLCVREILCILTITLYLNHYYLAALLYADETNPNL